MGSWRDSELQIDGLRASIQRRRSGSVHGGGTGEYGGAVATEVLSAFLVENSGRRVGGRVAGPAPAAAPR